MAFRCPYCQFTIVSKKTPKPGSSHTAKCPKCVKPFSLVIPKDVDADWIVLPMEIDSAQVSRFSQDSSLSDSDRAPTETPISHNSSSLKPIAETPVKEDATCHEEFAAKSKSTELATGITELPLNDSRGRHDTFVQTKALVEASPVKSTRSFFDDEPPKKIGGYEIIRELGRGGMGTVFLARQISLDRLVALKVMNTRWTGDPIFFARFTREAFAAAQLLHHNIVQIYDIGEQNGLQFFSMEYVDGRSLGDMVKKDGPLAKNDAIRYTIQAARGLKFAHDHGMIHRDVKPDNLILNIHGVLKVADLGLVKTPHLAGSEDQPMLTEEMGGNLRLKSGLGSLPADITRVNTAMGSPAYMSPEQCRDATKVDRRADIYSLGCTLYAILAGRPPFQGTSPFDVMTKHATEPIVSIPEIPGELDVVLRKSLAKSAQDRYQSMDEFIVALEKCLPNHAIEIRPTEEQISKIEQNALIFRENRTAKQRKLLLNALLVAGSLATILGVFIGGLSFSMVLLMLTTESIFAYFIIDGAMRKTLLYRKACEWLLGVSVADWLIAIAGAGLSILVLFSLGLHWLFLGTTLLAIGSALSIHFLLDRKLITERASIIEETEAVVRRLRIAGMEEDSLQLFVAQNSGTHWEEFFEALFGFESKRATRPRLLEIKNGVRLAQYGAWRDSLTSFLDAAILRRKERRAAKLIARIESLKSSAKNSNLISPNQEAKSLSANDRTSVKRLPSDATIVESTNKLPATKRAMLDGPRSSPLAIFSKISSRFFGIRFRVVLALMLIASGALWARQFKSQELASIKKSGEALVQSENSKTSEFVAQKALGVFELLLDRQQGLKVLGFDMSRLVDSINPLVAGLILLSSIFYGHRGAVILCMFGAAIAAVPHLIVGLSPEAIAALEKARIEGGISFQFHQLTMLAGISLGVIGFMVGYRRR